MTGFDKYKKVIARVLLAAFFFAYYPFVGTGTVYAAPDEDSSGVATPAPNDGQKSSMPLSGDSDEKKTGAATGNAGQSQGSSQGQGNGNADAAALEVTPYKVSADPAPSYTAFKNMTAWSGRTTITAPENTYVLTASTGASAGDTVLYFSVKYVDTDGISRSQYVFPGIDAASRSRALLNYYAKKAGVSDITATYGGEQLKKTGYSEAGPTDSKLAAWSVQDFAFRTDAEIKTVNSIDVYLAKGQWTVQGLSLYKMNSYKGYEEYGLVSGSYFLDFEGYQIAELIKKNQGTLTLQASKNDTMISIGGTESLYFDIQNYDTQDHKKGFAVNDDLYSFRFDFTDQIGSGISSFLNSSGVNLKGDMGIVEDIVLEIQYRDVHGWNRKVSLPVVLSSYIMARAAEGDSELYGFAQKGDTIAFQGVLPEFEAVSASAVIRVGGAADKALEANGIKMSSPTAKMQTNLSGVSKQVIRLSGCSMYKGGCMPFVRGGTDSNGKHLAGATLEYVFASQQPMLYYTTTVGGKMFEPGSSVKVDLVKYKSGSPIIATKALNDVYMVTIYTTDKKNAGTSGDVNVRFSYLDADGDAGHTETYNVKTAAEDFLGPWPSTTGGSYISENGLQRGGSISFLIEAKSLQEFTKAEITHSGSDFWEMKNLTIDYVEKYTGRKAYIAPDTIKGTRYWITREMLSAEVFNLARTSSRITDENGKNVNGDGTKEGDKKPVKDEQGNIYYGPDGQPIYEDTGKESDVDYWKYGGQLFLQDQTLNIDFGKGSVTDGKDVDYSAVRYKMTHAQTQTDWGFFKKRKTYNVAVKVAKDSDVDTGNGDAGSVNYFYFQLVFSNGKSAYVQANQQLAGDAFRSGNTENFTISTNRDYGDVEKINIVPEDLASDSKPFDKLNIDTITVTEQTTGGTHISYVFDQVGWIEIDYRDEAENSSIRGLRARSSEELAQSFTNPYKERSVKLLCEVSTLPWEGDYHQFQGSVWASVTYIKASDNSVATTDFDVVQCLAAYQNKSAATMEAATNPAVQAVSSAGQGSISDPDLMFRPGKQDRFIMPSISDLKSLKSITFTAQTKNNEGAYLNIGKVSVSQILEDGPVQLTDSGELYRNFKTKKLALNSESKVYSKYLPMGTATKIGPINFTDNELVWSSEQWATPVARIPDSSDDTVNIYVYPTVSGGNADSFFDTLEDSVDQNDDAGVVHANLAYSIPYAQKMAAACDLKTGKDGMGHRLYYATGVKAPNFISMDKLSIQCTSSQISFNHAIIQHVKGDVILSSSTCNFFDTTAALRLSADLDYFNQYEDSTEESILLAFGGKTKPINLQSVNNDVAVAFTYTSSIDGGSKEYISPYVYLTDQEYKSIREGLVAEVKFDVPYVRAITGYRIAAYGNVKGNIYASAGVVYSVKSVASDTPGEEPVKTKTLRSYASFADNYELSDKVTRHKTTTFAMKGEKSVTPVSLTFTSKNPPKTSDGTKDAAVRMKLSYTDVIGQPRVVWFNDIRNYIQGDAQTFASEKPVTIQFFLADMDPDMGIQNLELCPYDPDVEIPVPGTDGMSRGGASAVDSLVKQLREGTGMFADGLTTSELATTLYKARSATWTISKVEYDAGFHTNYLPREMEQTFDGMENGGVLRLNSVEFTTYISKNNTANQQVKNHNMQMVAVPGDIIAGTVTLKATTAGFTAKAYRMVGEAGEEVPPETLVLPPDSRIFYFYVPKNPTADIAIYRIDVSPVDAPDLVDSIYVSVEGREITMASTYALNDGAEAPVRDHNSILVAKAGDVLKTKAALTNSTEGVTVNAYRMVGDAGEDVTSATVTKQSATDYSFKVPENTSGNVVQYKVEITSVENPELKDTIYISVESTPKPETTEQTTTSEENNTETPATDAGGGQTPADQGGTPQQP